MMDLLCILLQAPPGSGGSTSGGGESSLLVWGVVLLSVAAALLLVELLVPSGGLIGLCAAVAAVGGLVCLFYEDTTLGLVTTLAVLLASPFIAAFMLKVWPHTPIGRLLILRNESGSGGATPLNRQADPGAALPGVGATGTAHTGLRPVGVCVFNGQRVECLADAGMIDAGTAVRIVGVEGKEVRVRQILD